jgi:cytochrome b subunit of formate dehydrogenase
MRLTNRWITAGVAFAAASAISLCAWGAAPSSEDCLQCHSDSGMAATKPTHPGALGVTAAAREGLSLQVTKDSLKGSIHEGLSCADCHTGVTELPHPEKLPKPTCSCHDDVASKMTVGVHAEAEGASAKVTPKCADCHGAHQIRPKSDPASSVNPLNIPATCGACHGNKEGMEALGIRSNNAVANFLKSDHWISIKDGKSMKAASCVDCHGTHIILRSSDPASPVHKTNIPRTCGKCHEGIRDQYDRSVHGRALAAGHFDAPSCADCHGEHDIEKKSRETSRVNPAVVGTVTCAECHSSVRMTKRFNLPQGMVKSYQASFHGLATKYGQTNVANCASCHGVHDILPSKDEASSINPKNLQHTCGKCHPGAGDTFSKTPIHLDLAADSNAILAWIQKFYWLIIAATLGAMALHNLMDYVRHFLETMKRLKPVAVYVRMTRSERIQHILLLTSFLTLVVTGFALKYPDSVWALPFRYVPGGFEARGWIHRIAAVVMVLDSVYHVYYLIASKRGRRFALDMIPTLQDAKDAVEQIGYYLGYRGHGARFPRFSYAEKAEYLALVWGTVVMVGTGFVLWFKTFFAQYMPIWGYTAAELIHFYEAILAFSAIVIWHFYAVFSHTEKSPYNPTWVTGQMTRHEMEHYHPKELEKIEKEGRTPPGGHA